MCKRGDIQLLHLIQFVTPFSLSPLALLRYMEGERWLCRCWVYRQLQSPYCNVGGRMLGLTQFQGTWNNVLTRTAHCHPPFNNPSHGADSNLKSLRGAQGQGSLRSSPSIWTSTSVVQASRWERSGDLVWNEVKRPTAARAMMELTPPSKPHHAAKHMTCDAGLQHHVGIAVAA